MTVLSEFMYTGCHKIYAIESYVTLLLKQLQIRTWNEKKNNFPSGKNHWNNVITF